jgi:uncharacterized membrane protein YraQ (UPF0718 family)
MLFQGWHTVAVIANFVFIAILVANGLQFFAHYHRDRYRRGLPQLLASLGMLALAGALLITPVTADVIAVLARTRAAPVLLAISIALLLGCIAVFGVQTSWKASQEPESQANEEPAQARGPERRSRPPRRYRG